MALMVVDKRALAQRFFKDKHPHVRMVNQRTLTPNDMSGFRAGQEAGKNMPINKGVGGSRDHKKLS